MILSLRKPILSSRITHLFAGRFFLAAKGFQRFSTVSTRIMIMLMKIYYK